MQRKIIDIVSNNDEGLITTTIDIAALMVD